MTKSAPKPRLAVVATAAAVLIAGAATWAVYNRAESTAPAARGAGAPSTLAAGAKPPAKTLDKPLWRELTRAQQTALKPLQPEWDGMDGMRKRRWLELSARFASMSPAEQGRVHERMRQWMKLTPAQRNLARENFSKTRKLAPGQKAATWESYKQLSEEEKRKLARAKPQAAPALPHSPIIDTPVSCPPGATRRGTTCILPAPATAANLPAPPAPANANGAPAAAVPAATSSQSPTNASSPGSPSNASNPSNPGN